MAPMTGGTPAPTAAPLPAHGAPHGASPHPMRAHAEKRFLNRGNGKMETREQMHATHARHEANRQSHGVPAGHVVNKTTTKTTSTVRKGGGTQLPSWVNMTPEQLRQFASNLVNKEVNAGRVPFKERAAQLGTEEADKSSRYDVVAQHGAEAEKASTEAGQNNAKTARNFAADVLAKAESPTPQAGLTAGSPVAQEIEARRAAAAKAIGQINSDSLNKQVSAQEANERAGVQNQVYGAQYAKANMLQGFAKQRAENSATENAFTAKKPAEIQSTYQNLLGEQAKIRTAREANHLEVAKIQSGENKSIRTTTTARANAREQAETARRGQNFTAQAHRESVEATKRGQDLTRASAQERTAATREHNSIYAQVKRETANGTKPNPAAGRKYMSLVDSAIGYASRLKAEGKNPAETRQAMTELTEGAGGKEGVGYPPNIVDAAIHVVRYRRFSAQDKKVARSYGLAPSMRPEWFQEAPGYKNGKPAKKGH